MGLVDRIRSRKSATKCEWENPKESIGEQLGRIRSGKYICWKPVGRARDAWDAVRPSIKEYLDNFCKSNSSSVILELYMIGKTEETASPIILICSSDKATRKSIRNIITENGFLANYAGLGLGDTNELPDRRMVRRMAEDKAVPTEFGQPKNSQDLSTCETTLIYTFQEEKSVLGRKLFAVSKEGKQKHVATGGPILWLNGQSYQLTVAHVLEDDDGVEDCCDGSSISDQCSFDFDSDDLEDATEPSHLEVPSIGSRTPDELQSLDSDEDCQGEQSASSQDIGNRFPTQGFDINSRIPFTEHNETTATTTQRQSTKTRNAPRKWLEVTPMNTPARQVGKMFMSSNDSSQRALDYALVELDRNPKEHNTVQFQRYGVERSLKISQIATIGSCDAEIVAWTASNGVVKGKLLAAASYMRLPNQTTFQELFPVRLDAILCEGDCGTAIIDQTTGQFYGHIVAGTPGTGLAYLVPGTSIFQDITHRIGFEPRFDPVNPSVPLTTNAGTVSQAMRVEIAPKPLESGVQSAKSPLRFQQLDTPGMTYWDNASYKFLPAQDRLKSDPYQLTHSLKLSPTRDMLSSMISFSISNRRIERLAFSKDDVAGWREKDETHGNWPVVYVLDDDARDEKGKKKKLRDVYVGESLNAAARMRQHLETKSKKHLRNIRIIFDESFNKSVCLDLESYLIKMLAGDGGNQVLNRNNGITESRYYQREIYRESFRNIFLQLKTDGMFTRSIPEIENSSLFKLSPFKALTEDQANSVENIVRSLLEDADGNSERTIVIQGDPGTGKTVVAIYIIKLLLDIKTFSSLDDLDTDARFSEFFTTTIQNVLRRLKRIGLVIPQQALRASVQDVFRKTKGLDPKMVMTAFEVGKAKEKFDLLLVDETHRLGQRANQVMGTLNRDFKVITETLYGDDDKTKTQLDWIQTQSQHRILFLDTKQGVRPADLPHSVLTKLVADARAARRHFLLQTQMRVQAGSNFVSLVRWILDPHPDARQPDGAGNLGSYDFALFDDFNQMRDEIRRHDAEVGLSRLVAGFAWDWRSKEIKKNGKRMRRASFDIEIEGTKLCWNGDKEVDWIYSTNALEEVGSIHTVQGYDLNYVGVIIGLDLRFDLVEKRLFVDRDSYFDKKGKENNKALGRIVSDEDLLQYITQIYGVLMTRGIRGTYVYACDAGLREYLRGYIPTRS